MGHHHHHVHHALHLKTLGRDSGVTGPRNEAWQVKLTDPAISVMSDFRERVFFKVNEDEQIDEALAKMKHAGLRAAFVLDKHNDKLLGVITSYDISGEKPMRFMQSSGVKGHKDIKVADVMENVADVVALDLHDVEQATVQSVLDALQKSGRTHLPVIEHKKGEAPHLRGLFSASKVMRLTEDARHSATQAKAA